LTPTNPTLKAKNCPQREFAGAKLLQKFEICKYITQKCAKYWRKYLHNSEKSCTFAANFTFES
jgi:hypothetical protein